MRGQARAQQRAGAFGVQVDALERAQWNRREAARLLGIGKSTLYRKLRAYGIELGGDGVR